ncbi:MAG: hypothetical protein ABI321_07300 [Polyangia bacterium]
MRRLALTALVSLLGAAGCYDPKPPSGSYLCGAGNACPSGLSCDCGQCVTSDENAACGFTIALASKETSVDVAEHEKFDVIVQALDNKGGTSTTFEGDVTLSSTWGDVCVGTAGCVGTPDVVHLVSGSAQATIQLNRETNAPQSAILRASFAGNVGSSGLTTITVYPQQAVRDAQPIAPSIAMSSYGFARYVTGYPYVIKDATGWHLYFVGGVKMTSGFGPAVGLAASSDGITWTPPTASLFSLTSGGTVEGSTATEFGGVAAYATTSGVSLFFGRDADTSSGFGYNTIASAEATTASGPFDPAAPAPSIQIANCPSCSGMGFPTVIVDPNRTLSGGGPDSTVMFFSAAQVLTAQPNMPVGLSVLRATALDGRTFAVDPSPAIESTLDERTISAPRILVDGHTYKMWYTFAPDPLVNGGTSKDAINPCAATSPTSGTYNAKLAWKIGYATSSDGYFWVRSDTNTDSPVLGSTMSGSDSQASLLLGSVYPADGVDASNGIALYYSPVRRSNGMCAPDGMGRAVRP